MFSIKYYGTLKLTQNLLLRNFMHRTDQVKCTFFQSSCTNIMYCCQTLLNSTMSVDELEEIIYYSYNSVLRCLLGISKH